MKKILGSMKTRLQSFANEAPKRGRARRGTPILRARSRYATQYTLHAYAKRSGVLHWDLSDRNADTKEIERVAIDVVGAMKSGETVIWDRLGRSGRAVNPSSQHYSPVARDLFEEVWRVDQVLASEGQVF